MAKIVEKPVEKPLVVHPDTHISIEGEGFRTHELAAEKLPRMFVDGRNVEHVSDSPEGVWIYRPM